MIDNGRRSFLRAAGAAAGLAALSACTSSNRTSAVSASDWNALAKDLAGPLVRPGSSSYDTDRRLFDPRFDNLRPTGIAYCRVAQDVATCLAFVRQYDLPVAARCGGHSYAGWSSTTGLIVDVTSMGSVQVDPAAGTVTAGAGTRLIDFYNGLAAQGRAVPGGSCPTVGLAGLALGGGVGVVSRAYGLTSDNLVQLQVVTADGRIRTCDSTSDADLFWACRGGGGGNFGVATSFTFTTHPISGIVLFFLSWPWSQAARVIAAWQSWAPPGPDQLWSNLHLPAGTGGTPSIEVGGTYLGSVAEAATLLDQLYAAAGSQPSSHFLENTSYLHAMLVEAGCTTLSVEACHLPGQTPGGQLSRQAQFTKSDIFTQPLSSAGIGTLLSGTEKFLAAGGASGGSGGVAFDALGGAVNRVAPGATAYVHRDGLFQAQYTTDWPGSAPASAIGRQQTWLRSFYGAAHRYASGQAYQNYIDPGLTDWRQAYYGANYSRLSQVKARYDPGHLFRFPQAIT
ncbi:MAG TPA: FAD-binding oxidoreductase [Streptosporangiaceae bacterium]|nr:FAD-binding oxidoreductase [Streptosporangiaceae bacterium]